VGHAHAARAGHRAQSVTCAIASICIGFVSLFASFAHAAQVQHLNTQTATATAGTPTIASFNIPSGKNRVLFIWPTFERDHCSDADVAGGLCDGNNAAGTGLGDNYPEPRIGTPPAPARSLPKLRASMLWTVSSQRRDETLWQQ
jgi:hypothetical protein